MLYPNEEPQEYSLRVSTDDIHEAIAQVGSALYALVEEALQAHEDHEAEECDFEPFARDVLSVLTSHADQLSCDGIRQDEPEDDEPMYD